MDATNTRYFTHKALEKMISVQGKTIETVVVFLWQNTVDANSSLEIIDGLQLRFTDGERITIGCNENGDGLDILDYNFKDIKKQLEVEFAGKIKLHALDASKTKMWLDVTGKQLKAIQLTKSGDNYISDSVMLDIDDEPRTVAVSPYDGIVIDYYDKD